MVTKEHVERRKSLNRAVYNDWGLYSFVQMLSYKCLLGFEDLSSGGCASYQQAV